jgi:hypothetical protein
MFAEEAVGDYDPSCLNKIPNHTRFWEEATRIAAQLEQSADKTTHAKDLPCSTYARFEDQPIIETLDQHVTMKTSNVLNLLSC